MNILVSTLLAFLPSRYREMFTPHAIPYQGALVGGIAEAATAFFLLIRGYQTYTAQRLATLDVTLMTKAAEKGGESAIMGFGGFLLLEYALHFTTLLLVFLTVEGIVRAATAVGSGETLPTLPLHALSVLHARLAGGYQEKRMGKRIPDEAQRSANGGSLHIASCRPKEWTRLTTVSYEGGFYELAATREAAPPRPFVYILRKKPVTLIIRGIHEYDPNEVLESKD
jgi:hypothetical protein